MQGAQDLRALFARFDQDPARFTRVFGGVRKPFQQIKNDRGYRQSQPRVRPALMGAKAVPASGLVERRLTTFSIVFQASSCLQRHISRQTLKGNPVRS